MKNKYSQRVERLRGLLKNEGLDGLYISHEENVSYFTGKKGSDCCLWISQEEAVIFTDFRYREMALELSGWLKYVELDGKMRPVDYLSSVTQKLVGVERDYMSLRDYLDFKEVLEVQGNKKIKPCEGLCEELRMVKDEEEIELIRQAEEITALAFNYITGYIKPGMTERQIAVELEHLMMTHGSEGISFDTIVVSGAKSSYPHGVPDGKLIEAGDFITMDYGAMVGGYHADMTRTVAVAYATEEMKKVYDIVLRAQTECCKKIKAGMLGCDAHRIASDIIEAEGYGAYFGHGLGHGTGLEIHEKPSFSPRYKYKVEENTVMSIEPGIYLPKKFGVRIEDLCVVKTDGIINLSVIAPKELIIL